MFRGRNFIHHCTAIWLTFAAAFVALPAGAELLTEKGRVDLVVGPGETVSDTMYVYNSGRQDIDVRLYWQDFEYVPPYRGQKVFSAPGTSAYSMGDWVSYSPQVLTVPAHGKRMVRFTIRVPEDAQGGRYGVLFFEQSLNKAPGGDGYHKVKRIGTLFYVETPESDKSAAIEDVRIQDGFIRGRFTNRGNVYLFPRGSYHRRDSGTTVADRGKLEMLYVMPGASADFTLAIPPHMTEGEHTMMVAFDLGDGDNVISEIDYITLHEGGHQIKDVRDRSGPD